MVLGKWRLESTSRDLTYWMTLSRQTDRRSRSDEGILNESRQEGVDPKTDCLKHVPFDSGVEYSLSLVPRASSLVDHLKSSWTLGVSVLSPYF